MQSDGNLNETKDEGNQHKLRRYAPDSNLYQRSAHALQLANGKSPRQVCNLVQQHCLAPASRIGFGYRGIYSSTCQSLQQIRFRLFTTSIALTSFCIAIMVRTLSTLMFRFVCRHGYTYEITLVVI